VGHCGFRFRRHPVVQLLTVSDAIELVAERSERAGDFSFDPRSKVAGRLRHGPALVVHKIVGVGLDRDLEGRNEASGEQRIGGDDAIGLRKALSGLGGRRRQVAEDTQHSRNV
jgi:hypothetical protein